MHRREALFAMLASMASVPYAGAAEPGKESSMKNAERIVPLRSQKLVQNAAGYNVWQVRTEERKFVPAETALVLCDVWDKHWCRGANERLAPMLPRMNETVKALRQQGVLIVHAPSDTMKFYEGTAARKRVLDAPKVAPPADGPHDDPPLPVDASDQGTDTGEPTWSIAWKQQHPAIEIDPARDAISDQGAELYNLYRQRGIKNVIIMGVHTNMCVLHRTFAIKQLVRWGFNVALVRDLTDTMYNPARSPYVSHEEGTRLVVEFIEKFWCPTVTSAELLK
jgi:nicotinamidase-related amidase